MVLKTECFNMDYLQYVVIVFDLWIGCIIEDLVYKTNVVHIIKDLNNTTSCTKTYGKLISLVINGLSCKEFRC